jgi:PPM family protein phosphatase
MTAITCPRCQKANRPGANYCASCGLKLRGSPVPGTGAAGPPTRPLNSDQVSPIDDATQPYPMEYVADDSLAQAAATGLEIGYRSDVGLLRELNEDSLVVLNLVHGHRSLCLSAIADGMGGHQSGEIASSLLIQTLVSHAAQNWLAETGEDSGRFSAWLDESIQTGNRAVFERAQQAGSDMGTTIVAALIVDGEAYIAHVGDSRAYHLTAGGLRRITTDHSFVEQLVASGEITRQQARRHPHAHVILRTIGDEPDVEVDHYRFSRQPGEQLLLCSDGLTTMLSDEHVRQILVQAESPQAACDTLVEEANSAGGEDNISVIVIRWGRMS